MTPPLIRLAEPADAPAVAALIRGRGGDHACALGVGRFDLSAGVPAAEIPCGEEIA
ncbi:hypothetical protein [Microvirga lenta]|uniref:hypothetical protein n=1 Tax=Microvirga lenta TaxID=2881337 RepID=UPI001CFC63B8|nr:hypothetical protein [Microvirga lenta]MCB5174656.1 hypothetical protein [Microvirga lenta]